MLSSLSRRFADVRVVVDEPFQAIVDPEVSQGKPGNKPGGGGGNQGQQVPWGITAVNAVDAWSVTKGAGVAVCATDTGDETGDESMKCFYQKCQVTSDRKTWRVLAGCAAPVIALLVVLLMMPQDAARAGKGGNKPPSPPPPPVSYELIWLGTFGGYSSIAIEINNNGVVVGWGNVPGDCDHAFRVVPVVNPDGTFVYDLDGDGDSELMEDLNDLGPWVDETGAILADQDWTAEEARGINSHGEIVGTAIHNITGERSAFLFDPLAEVLMLLPAVGPGDHYGSAINDDGDIVGERDDGETSEITFYRWDEDAQAYFGIGLGIPTYYPHLNNRGIGGEVQIVTRFAGLRITLWPDLVIENEDIEDFGDRYDIWGINDFGTFCGRRAGIGKGKNGEPDMAFRWSGDPSEPLTVIREAFDAGTDVNSAGDVSVLYSGLYTDEDGVLALNDLVIDPDNLYGGGYPYGINDRDASGFPQICGQGRKFIGTAEARYQFTAMVLTPVLPGD